MTLLRMSKQYEITSLSSQKQGEMLSSLCTAIVEFLEVKRSTVLGNPNESEEGSEEVLSGSFSSWLYVIVLLFFSSSWG